MAAGMTTQRGFRVGIVAGEASGDRLGGALIRALRARAPNATFRGMAGPHMRAAGCASLADISQLSVMGLVEVLRSYPRLLRLRAQLEADFVADPPDVVIGIDVPDFNLGLERRLKAHGITTVHYVCPQLWAWRAGRARSLARSTDVLLALLPFEAEYCSAHGIETHCVGHPLADELPLEPDRVGARVALGLPPAGPLIALMPGSRQQEIERLLPPFVDAAMLIAARRPEARFVLGVAHENQLPVVRASLRGLPCTVVAGLSHQALSAADVALVASGTVTLEALLCATPMVVGYRLAALSYHIIKRMVTIPRIALPNIIADEALVPELIQDAMTPPRLAAETLAWLDDDVRTERYRRRSRELHATMRRGAAARAAEVILERAGCGS